MLFMNPSKRITLIAAAVVLLHAAGIWALQNGLLRQAAQLVVPVAILSQIIEPPVPQVETPPFKPQVTQPLQKPVEKPRALPATPAPIPVAVIDNTPAPNAPTGVLTLQPPAAPAAFATAAAVPMPSPAPPTPAKLELPSSDADYLNNPKPHYPPISKRMGEQGKVIVRVLIGTDGHAQKAEIRSSSSYDRLDEAAMATVLRWRYVPGKRNGVAEAMWFNVPIQFVLE